MYYTKKEIFWSLLVTTTTYEAQCPKDSLPDVVCPRVTSHSPFRGGGY